MKNRRKKSTAIEPVLFEIFVNLIAKRGTTKLYIREICVIRGLVPEVHPRRIMLHFHR